MNKAPQGTIDHAVTGKTLETPPGETWFHREIELSNVTYDQYVKFREYAKNPDNPNWIIENLTYRFGVSKLKITDRIRKK